MNVSKIVLRCESISLPLCSYAYHELQLSQIILLVATSKAVDPWAFDPWAFDRLEINRWASLASTSARISLRV